MGTATLYSNNKIHVIIPQESVPRTCIKDRLSEEADGSALLVALTAASSVK